MAAKKAPTKDVLGLMVSRGGAPSSPSRKTASESRRRAVEQSPESDVDFELPKLTAAFVEQINALSPPESDFEVLEG